MSLRYMSVCQVYGETPFSQPIIKKEVYFFYVQIPSSISDYSVNISPVGQATKGRNVKIQNRDFLGCYLR